MHCNLTNELNNFCKNINCSFIYNLQVGLDYTYRRFVIGYNKHNKHYLHLDWVWVELFKPKN